MQLRHNVWNMDRFPGHFVSLDVRSVQYSDVT